MATLLLSALPLFGAPADYFAIQVLDDATGRGVPLVELRTVNKVVWWTDSNGIVAFDEPGLMDRDVYFHVSSPGYEMPADGFGYRGVKLHPVAGSHAVVRLHRLNIAERLYRVTGQGIYADSVRVGQQVPLKQPTLDGQVMGQDTVIATPYRGKIYWFWGDTDRPSYPLGNFHASGATSELPGHGGLDPAVGVDLTYFVDENGFAKAMCPLPAEGLHWIESLFTVPDEHGVERLAARMANMRDLGYAHDYHLMIFNDDRACFETVQRWDLHEGHGSSHPFLARVDGRPFYYLFPDYRMPADLKSLADLNRYEAFTCLAGDGKWHGAKTALDRDNNGRLRYTWRAGADRVHAGCVTELVKAGKLKREETWWAMRDFKHGAALKRGLESVAWNAYRRRWIAFFADKPGEAWFAEADTPLGPWGYGRRIVTHGEYNFYNLAHHPFFDQDGGRLVYFEGTYTATFSDARCLTPRYDYNQLMYRLALDDPRLRLPVAVYRVGRLHEPPHLWLRDQVAAARAWGQIEEVAWFALPPEAAGTNRVSVYALDDAATTLSITPPRPDARPLFVGLPLSEPESAKDASGTEPDSAPERRSPALRVLREFRRVEDQARWYSIASAPPADWLAEGRPLCRVWEVPSKVLALDWKAQPQPALK